MKKVRDIFCVLLLLCTTMSCENWLDVDPKTEIKSELMFHSESGFKDALMGVYLTLRDPELYGKEATWGFVDAIGQQTDIQDQAAAYYNASRYNYSQTSGVSDALWAKAFNAIVNLNNMLENLDEQQNLFTPATYGVLKGEALGLRAFLHFDLVRLFGWGNLAKKPENLEKLCMPYMTKYDKVLTKQLTVGEVLAHIEEDLLASIELLNNSDPYGLAPKSDDYDLPNEDKFFDNREKRFNYWAAVCTLTRVYMWMGRKREALPLATSFIDKGGRTSWIDSYTIDAYYEKDRDLTFSREHVFALDIAELFESVKHYIDPNANKPNRNADLLYHSSERANKLFEAVNGVSTDYRYKRWYNKVNDYFDGWAFYKYWEVEEYSHGSVLPLIRKPEMYYMAAECLLETGNAADRIKAIEYLNTVRDNRGIAKLGNDMTAGTVQDEITKEYQREFIGEGQLFYYYKRLGFEKIPYSTKPGSDAVYVVPLPSGDVGLGGMEDYKKK